MTKADFGLMVVRPIIMAALICAYPDWPRRNVAEPSALSAWGSVASASDGAHVSFE